MKLARVIRPVALALACMVLASAAEAAGVPPTLQYQGRLTDATSGAPLNGPANLVFSIWDDPGPSAGTQLWTQSFTNVPLVGGQFTVIFTLTGANDFKVVNAIAAGTKLYVQTSVNGTGLNGSGTSAARQEITSVLSALRAQEADTAKVALALGAGAAVTAVNGLHDGVTLAGGSGVAVTPGGQTLTLSAQNVPGAALVDNSVSSAKLSNESGIGYNLSLSQSITIGSYAVVDSITITTPGPGYVAVEATSTLKLVGRTTGSVEDWYAIDTSPTGSPATMAPTMGLGHVTLPNEVADAEAVYIPVHAERVYSTTGASHTFYFKVSAANGSAGNSAGYNSAALYSGIIAHYFPTAYGNTPAVP